MAHAPTYDDEKDKSPLNIKEDEYEHGKHPNSLKNLTPHPKGVSGNLAGRRPNYTKLKEELSKIGDEIIHDYYDKPLGTRREVVLKRIWDDAQKGDMKKIQLLAWLGSLEE